MFACCVCVLSVLCACVCLPSHASTLFCLAPALPSPRPETPGQFKKRINKLVAALSKDQGKPESSAEALEHLYTLLDEILTEQVRGLKDRKYSVVS